MMNSLHAGFEARACIRMRACGALLLVALLPGCGVGSVETFFVRPGHFDYHSCAELAKASASTLQSEQELKVLIERAEQGVLGGFIAATAYRSDYLKAQGTLKLLEETAQKKNCPVDPATGRLTGAEPRS